MLFAVLEYLISCIVVAVNDRRFFVFHIFLKKFEIIKNMVSDSCSSSLYEFVSDLAMIRYLKLVRFLIIM